MSPMMVIAMALPAVAEARLTGLTLDLQEAKRAYARAISAEAPPAVYVQACAQVARMESLTDSIEAGEPWLRLAARRASKEEPLGWSRLQLVLGIFERETGSPEEARERFMRLYDYCLEHDLHERAIDAAHHVVLVSEDLDEQARWSQRGIEAAEAGSQPTPARSTSALAAAIARMNRSRKPSALKSSATMLNP